MCGIKTNIVTAVEIDEMYTHDTLMFAPMVETTAKNFAIAEVSADKAYGSLANTDAVTKAGGTPFIAFKGSATGAAGGTFEQMFHYFMFKQKNSWRTTTAVERGVHVQHDEAEIRRLAAQQDRYRDGQRNAL